MNKWLLALPALLLLGFAAIGAYQLMAPDKSQFENTLRAAPDRTFETMDADTIKFNPSPSGEPIVVNLFASWCPPCLVEHPLLIDFSDRNPDVLFGILYEDTLENGRAYLNKNQDPYRQVGLDESGQGGLDFGLTGVPETFVIDADGNIVLHIKDPLDAGKIADIERALKSARR